MNRNIRALFRSKQAVNFIICGTQKGGTSALDAYLRQHSEICMADNKEVHFFDNEEYFATGEPDYSKYHAWFSPKKSHKVLGEACPIYMYWNNSAERMWEYNPDMKLIVLLRNPIERAYSHWNMERSRNAESLSFWEAIRSEKERCLKVLPRQHRVFSYIDRGFYLAQLRRLWAYFSRDDVLIIKSEDLKQRTQEVLDHVCEFLRVSKFGSITPKNVHSLPYVSSISKRERDYLLSIFEPGIKELETELNWNCSDWLER